MKLSIVIPALNEADILGNTLQSLKDHATEIIVVDGGSNDATVEVALKFSPHVYISNKGRGIQQHTGAYQARGNVLLFLHADTILPLGYQHMIDHAMAHTGVVFGAFHLRIHPPKPAHDLIAFMANLRSRILKVPYGDQALFVRRSAYFKVGGFQDWPIMEDVDLVRRLNCVGGFKLAQGFVQTSARRWQRENIVHATLRNWSLIIRYCLGVSPHSLARHYPDRR